MQFLLRGARRQLALAAALVLVAPAALAQKSPLDAHWEWYQVRSGNQANHSPVEGVVWREIITLPNNIPWLRLAFNRAQLGKGSYVRIASIRDGGVQVLNQVNLEQWSYHSAFFNGNAVMVELVAGPHTEKNYLEIDKIFAGDDPGTVNPIETICGNTDDRIPSANAAVGRLMPMGCTGWIIDRPTGGNDKVHLSAGHCFPSATPVLEFNVPSSAANCAVVHPSPNFQFAVDTATMQSLSGGIGNDYAVFRCFPNPNTGLTTFQAQGVSITLGAPPAVNGATDIVGYGTDGTNTNNAAGANNNCTCTPANGTGTRNQIQQYGTGTLASAAGTTATYVVDTCGGNSGSPVFNQGSLQAFAIHTNGGCTTGAGTTNSGTLTSAAAVQNAINAVGGRPSNDECIGAIPIVDGTNGSFNNAGTTASSPAFPCGLGTTTDVWYWYVATCTGNVTFSTCTATRNIDTVMEVFSGSCGTLVSLGCNDDTGGTCGFGSTVTVPLTVGQQYLVRVSGYGGATGAFDVVVTGCNAADECAGAIPLQLGANGLYTNRTSTTSVPAWNCAAGGNDLWFTYTVPAATVVTFQTCDAATTFDTCIEVFTGNCGALTQVGCNDDSCGLRSSITLTAANPTTYYLRVGGFGGSTGNFVLTVSQTPANDDCAAAVALTSGTSGPYSNINANTSAPAWACGAGGSDAWFTWTAPCNGVLIADTCAAGTNYDTTLQVFSGSCGALNSLGCNDDSCGLQSSITVPVTANATYWIRVGGFASQTGQFMLTLQCRPANDECTSAMPLAMGSNGPFSNAFATTSAPAWTCGGGGLDVWFSYTATYTAPHTFATCTNTRSFDTTIELFSGTCGSLTSMACNDDTCGLGSRVSANLVNGQTYFVRVGSFAGFYTGSFDVVVATGTGNGYFSTNPTGCGINQIAASGNPNIGGTVTWSLSNISGLPFLRYGFVQINQPLCPGSTCILGPDFTGAVFGASLNLNIPINPTFVGAQLGVQGVDFGPPSSCPGINLTLTDTIVLTVG